MKDKVHGSSICNHCSDEHLADQRARYREHVEVIMPDAPEGVLVAMFYGREVICGRTLVAWEDPEAPGRFNVYDGYLSPNTPLLRRTSRLAALRRVAGA